MRTKKNITEITKKEVNTNVEKKVDTSFLDRHVNHWFIDPETNELKIGSDFSDFLKGKTEDFNVKKIHSCDVKSWKFVETTDGKFVFLTSKKVLK
jgi:hypothetical protein